MLQALRAGRTPAEIREFLRVPRSTVYRIAKRVRAQQGEEDGEDQGEVTPELRNVNQDLGGREHQRLCSSSR